MAKGGTRIGGKPKGYKAKATLQKEAARELVRTFVTDRLLPMLEAQVAQAMGIKYLAVRQKSTGRFLRRVGASDPETHDPDKEIIEVWEKDPSIQSFTDLLNRAIDKPAEQEQAVAVSGSIVLSWQPPSS